MLRRKKVPGHVKRYLWKLIHTKLSFSQNIQAVLNSSWKRNEKHSDHPIFRPTKPHNQWFSCQYFFVFTLATEKIYVIRMACVSCQFAYIFLQQSVIFGSLFLPRNMQIFPKLKMLSYLLRIARFSRKKPHKFFAVRLTITAFEFPKTGVLSTVSDRHCIHICHLGV